MNNSNYKCKQREIELVYRRDVFECQSIQSRIHVGGYLGVIPDVNIIFLIDGINPD